MFEIELEKVNNGEINLSQLRDEVKNYILTPYEMSKRKDEIAKIDGNEIQLGRFMTSLYFLPILQSHGIEIELKDFFDYNEAKDHIKYINAIAEKAKKHPEKITMEDLKEEIANSVVKLSDVTSAVNSLRGITVNLSDIVKYSEENPEFSDLLSFNIPSGLELNEIEQIVTEKVNKCIEALKDADTVYKPLILGGAVNARQLGQTLVNIGLKPDIEGQVIPEPVNTSFLRGMRSRKDFMTCAIGARKALVISHNNVRSSGYLARKLLLLCSEVKLSDEERCNTKWPIPIEMTDRKTYNRFIGRYALIKMYNPTIGNYEEKEVLIEDDEEQYKSMYGTKVPIYSPMTCACKDGVCRRCYGELSKVNDGMHIGVIAVLLLTEKLTQMLLSSKHLLMAKTEKVEWSEDFLEGFSVVQNTVLPKPNSTKIKIDVHDVNEDDDGDKYTNVFYVKHGTKFVKITTPKKMFFYDELSKEVDIASQEVVQSVNPENPIFFIKTKNIELGSTLNAIIELLQKPAHHGLDNDYIAIVNEFIKNLNESSLALMAVHSEIILSTLIKDASTGVRPDFSSDESPNIVADYVSNAIMNAEALSTSLSFEQIKKQLYNVSTYNKTKEGVFDPLFV